MNRQVIWKATMVLAACAVLVFAVHRLVTRAGGEDPAPDDQFVAFHCLACSRDFELSHRDIDNVLRQGDVGRDEIGHGMLFRCPHCGELRGERRLGTRDDAPPTMP